MSILDRIEAYLNEAEETWVCDECGWEGKKSELKEGNACPKCGAKPPTVHVKKVEEGVVGSIMKPIRKAFYTARIKKLEKEGWKITSQGKAASGSEAMTLVKGTLKKHMGWDEKDKEWYEADR